MRHRHTTILAAAVALVLSWAAVPAYASSTSYTWIGSAQGSGGDNHSWTDAHNWSPGGVPGDGDSVTIAPPDLSHCTAHVDAVPTVSLASLSLSSGPNSGCGSASVNTGLITVTGSFSWNGGSLNTPTTIAAGAAGTISGTNSKLNVLAQNLDVAGTLTLSAVADSGASNQGGFRIITDADGARVLHVLSGGTLISSGANAVQDLACCTNPAKIVNDGTLEVSAADFIVHGVEVDQNATLSASAGGRLVTEIAPLSAGAGATYSGTGSWLIKNGAKAKLAGTQNIGSGFHLELGGLDVDAGAQLGGTATLAGAGEFDWTGGTVEGNLTIAHTMTVHASGVHNGNGKRVLSGTDALSSNAASTLTNHGTITVEQGASILMANPAKLVNGSDGALRLAPGTQFTHLSCCIDPNRIVNDGGQVTVPAGSSTDPVVLDGVAYAATGGSTSIAGGRTLQLSGGARGALTSTTVSGGGTLVVADPTTVGQTITVGSATVLNLAPHGSLDGTATFGGTGAVGWTGGSVSGAVTLATGAGTTVSGTDQKYLSNVNGGGTPSTLALKSHTTITGGTSATHDIFNLGQSTLTLASSTTVRNFVDIYAGTLVNTGTLTVNPGAGATVVRTGSGPFTNRGAVTVKSGTFVVYGAYTQTAGVTDVATGATLARDNSGHTITLSGGVLEGTGTLRAGVVNGAGVVRPAGTGTGTLHITGTYTQGAKARLVIDVAKGTRDVLAVGAAATVRGTLAVHDVGRYHPMPGARATVLTTPALHRHPSCTVSSGSHTTGPRAGHWAPSTAATRLAVVWRAGAHTHC